MTFDAVLFGETVKVDDIRNAIYGLNSQTTQVSSLSVTTLARHSGSGAADVVCAAGELPSSGTITVNITGGITG